MCSSSRMRIDVARPCVSDALRPVQPRSVASCMAFTRFALRETRAVQHACDGGIADQVRVLLGNVADVNELHRFRITGRDMRGEIAEPFRESSRREPFRGTDPGDIARHVHGVQGNAVCRYSIICSTIRTPTISCASSVEPPMCGVAMHVS